MTGAPCSSLPPLQYVTVALSDELDGLQVMLTCIKGYHFPGGDTEVVMKCLPEGRWNTVPQDCQG